MGENERDELFESYVPGWPRDAQLTSSVFEQIADAIKGVELDSNNGTAADQYADAIREDLGLDGESWIVLRIVGHPLFGAHRWHACPACGHIDEAGEGPCPCCQGDRRTVCDACGEHACWAGRFMCDESATAGTRQDATDPGTAAWAQHFDDTAAYAGGFIESERDGLRAAARMMRDPNVQAQVAKTVGGES